MMIILKLFVALFIYKILTIVLKLMLISDLYCNLGTPSWGIAWYINDLLIPEITVVRGRTYTFIVEGGNDPANPAK